MNNIYRIKTKELINDTTLTLKEIDIFRGQ